MCVQPRILADDIFITARGAACEQQLVNGTTAVVQYLTRMGGKVGTPLGKGRGVH